MAQRFLRIGVALAAALLAIFAPWCAPDACLPRLEPYRGPIFEPPAAPDALSAQLAMDRDLLADLALGEDPEALAAVMWTAVNRSRESGRPLFHEVRNGRAYGTRRAGRWLPAWRWQPGRRWRHYPADWARAQRVAERVLRGELPDPTAGATHFHRAGTWIPSWAPPPGEWTRVGSHEFYVVG